MNDKNKKIIIIVSAVVAILFIWATIATVCTTVSNRKYNQLVEQYRQLIDESRARDEQYAQVYRAARETNRAVGESLSRCQSSLSELRATLQLIKERYTEMESLLYNIGDNVSNIDNNNCNTTDVITD